MIGYLAKKVAGAVLHHPDVRLGLPKADVVRPHAALIEVVRAAGRHHLGKAGTKGTARERNGGREVK